MRERVADLIGSLSEGVSPFTVMKAFSSLSLSSISSPYPYNWVRDCFEPLCRRHPNSPALIIAPFSPSTPSSLSLPSTPLTFSDILYGSDHFLSYLKSVGVSAGDHLYTFLPLHPLLWFVSIGAAKGGITHCPSSSLLSVRDLVYRFSQWKPKVVVSDEV